MTEKRSVPRKRMWNSRNSEREMENDGDRRESKRRIEGVGDIKCEKEGEGDRDKQTDRMNWRG